ncbi:MAG: DNA mismatch repair endonuclease MutL [Fibrobacterales bacterium]
MTANTLDMTQGKIKALSEECINKIAAGEVIERPSSVVKELLENCVDAGATSVTIKIDEGGKTLIKISDNGSGITPDDLDICFQRYTTSKLVNADDLQILTTNGFRGEALSSIAAVSQLEIESKTADNAVGKKVVIESGTLVSKEEVALDTGTTITVKNLFHNTPVRKKFMAGDQTELNRIVDITTRLALTHPDIQFTLSNGPKTLFHGAAGSIENRVTEILGATFSRKMLEVDWNDGTIFIRGFIGDYEQSKKRKTNRYFYLNNRPVSNHILASALDKAYATLYPGRYPLAVLFIEMPCDTFDVNVHPTKKEVRFTSDSMVYSSMIRAIKAALQGNAALPEIGDTAEAPFEKVFVFPVSESQVSNPTGTPPKQTTTATPPQESEAVVQDLFSQPENENIISLAHFHKQNTLFEEQKSQNIQTQDQFQSSYFQLHATFIIAETKSGMVIIDQNRAHQRILYEEARGSLENNHSMSIQQILFPEIIEFTPEEFTLVEEYLESFKTLAFDLEPFGNNCYQLRGIPNDMSLSDAEYSIRDMIAQIRHEPITEINTVDVIAKSYASGTAIKRGALLNHDQMASLMDSLFATEDPYISPFNKPIIVNMPLKDLNSKFGR